MNQSKLEWFLLSLLILVTAVVFWQVYTDMTQAGIASGGAFENAAAYPRALGVILGILLSIRIIIKTGFSERQKDGKENRFSFSSIKRPGLLLLVFSLYLLGLKILGYHLMTPVFLVIVLYLTGERKWPLMSIFGISSSLAVSFVFEVLLKVVLPGGFLRINIPWEGILR